jgi:hypothetical protein
MVGTCYEKCIDKKFKEGELNVGEARPGGFEMATQGTEEK